jgi:hypothetical protein
MSTTELSGSSYLHIINTNLERISQLPAQRPLNEMFVLSDQSVKINARILENDILRNFAVELFQKVTNVTLLRK